MIETIPSGTVLNGRYRIERVLGSGGFGHVYLAIDVTTHQQYAIKEYLVSGPSGQEQLMHEANVLSHLHHPNLPAFQTAFYERGRYYVVLNYIEGNDLTDIIRMIQRRNEVVPIAKIMEWILTTCDAVLFLHSQRPPVIHRDIKPDNIRIMPDGTAILVDLGNAKAAADGARTLFFIRHQGTPGYAPPEQYPGGSGTDARSDIYALGGALYFALTGQEPPSVSTRNQSIQQRQIDLPSLQDLLAKNPPEDSPEANEAKQFRLGVSKPAKPAPQHSRHLAQLAMLSPTALSQLNLVIQRAMAMKPRDRYQFVADFAHDLNKVMTIMPVQDMASSNTQPVTPASNPYSTQPDLPMLYDTIQNAKAAKGTGMPDVAEVLIGAPAMSQYSCPRCGAVHKPTASFCPQCGLSLTSVPRSTIGSTTVEPASTASGAPQQQAVRQDASVDATMVATPQVQQTPAISSQGSIPAAPISPLAPSAVQSQSSSIPSSWNTAPSSTGTSASSGIVNISPSQSMQDSNFTKARPGFHIGPGLVIAVLVILIILVAIMVVLLLTHGTHVFIQPAGTVIAISDVNSRASIS